MLQFRWLALPILAKLFERNVARYPFRSIFLKNELSENVKQLGFEFETSNSNHQTFCYLR